MEDTNEPVARSSADVKGSQSLVQATAGHGDSDEEEEKPVDPVAERKVRELGDQTLQPELSYSRTYDHDMYQGSELKADAARMSVNITTH